ncbi:MAG: hypothetical protein M0Z70_06855 [Nitrospiraceae bacterium]|nr:hypothetical protein [Nitrospiraceae bacterium]
MKSSENNNQVSDREHEELKLLYQVSVSDLAFFKRQQWNIANYTLLLYAALVGIAQLLRPSSTCCAELLISLLATVVFVVAVWVLWQLKRSIEVRRERLRKIRADFTERFNKAWQADKTTNDALILFVVLIGVLAIGLFFVWWLVYFMQPVTT